MKAAFCGSFSPPTIGHIDLIERASRLYETLYVFVGYNPDKSELYPVDQRVSWLKQACSHLNNVEICSTMGLSVAACREHGCSVLLRGIRNSADMDYEANMAWMNEQLDPKIATLSMFARPEYTWVSSSNVRELLRCDQSIEAFVPACVFADLQPGLYAQRKEAQ